MLNTPLQKRIHSLFETLIAESKEHGLQATAYHKGKLVLDVWAGTADPATRRPVDADTLLPIYSTGKGMTATIIHILAQRGRLSYDDPIAKFWPEFAANGKQNLTVKHALTHTSGLANLPMDVSYEQFHNWDAMCAWLANATPASPPGQEIVYHAVTYGWILGELARRVDGRPFMQQVREEICSPLGISTMFFGLPDDLESRVALIDAPPMEPSPTPAADLDPIPDCILPLGPWMNQPLARRACIPASNGIMNTRAMARHYAALLPAGIDGVELLPQGRLELAAQMQFATNHPGTPTKQGLGYVIGSVGEIFGDRPRAFGHHGYGGSTAFADPSAHFAMGFARNRFHDSQTPALVVKEIIRSLGIT